MIWTIATALIIACGVISALYMVGRGLHRGPERTINDVVQFLRPVDLEQVEILLDPGTEHELRWSLDRNAFRTFQRKRMHLYLELLKRMAHNAGVLVEFGNRQAERSGVMVAETIGDLQREAVRVRFYTLLTILKLYVLLAIRPMQTPSLSKLRRVGEVDGIISYKSLRECSVAVFQELDHPTDQLVLNY